MKIVINDCFGGFRLPDTCLTDLGISSVYRAFDYEPRNDPKLVQWVEDHPGFFDNDDCTRLTVVDIPDEATDWRITEYDGAENVLYVVDGKIYDYDEEKEKEYENSED